MRHFRERQQRGRGSKVGSMGEDRSVPGHGAGKEQKVSLEGLFCLVK